MTLDVHDNGPFIRSAAIAAENDIALEERIGIATDGAPRLVRDPGRRRLSAGRVIRESPLLGAPRIKSGFDSLDAATRGSFVGSLVILQGPPGSGKTTLAEQFGRAAMDKGAGGRAESRADEGGPSPAIELGQQLGLDGNDLEAGDEIAAARLDGLTGGKFEFLPAETTLRETFQELRSWPTTAQRVVLIDNLQAAEFDIGNGQEASERHLLTAKMVFLLQQARSIPALVLLISEVSRGSYASKDSRQWTSDLAAGAETRSIEYKADLLLTLRGSRGTLLPPDREEPAGPRREALVRARARQGAGPLHLGGSSRSTAGPRRS